MNKKHEKYRKWLQIARRIRSNSDILKPKLSESEYLETQFSRKDWLYFGVEEAKDCSTSSKPNVWFSVRENDAISIGLAFNSTPSVIVAENILKGYSENVKKELFEHLQTSSGWIARVHMRKKFHTFADTPKYELRREVKIKELTDEKIEELFREAKQIIEEYRQRSKLQKDDSEYLQHGGGVAFDLLYKEIPATEKDFSEAFGFAHDILEICLKIKTPQQNKKDLNKKFEAYQCKNRYCKNLQDPKKSSSRICDKCGADCKRVKITKDVWLDSLGYLPETCEDVGV